jgi:dihydroxyacid dehydratase/phosphogluconate dehydratase
VLHGNLCPNGAVIKPSAASPRLFSHRGRAVVFESIEELRERIDDPDLYIEHVTQADRGCDLDFLVGSSGSTVERESQ